MKGAIITLTFLALVGCGGQAKQMSWTGGDPKQLDLQMYECERDAKLLKDQYVYQQCMEVHGWSGQKVTLR